MDWSRAPSTSTYDLGGLAPDRRHAPLLALREVREIGLPAIFLDYGEALLYLDGQLFSLRDVRGPEMTSGVLPAPLPDQVLDCGVGIEYGWRHVAGCACGLCCDHSEERAA